MNSSATTKNLERRGSKVQFSLKLVDRNNVEPKLLASFNKNREDNTETYAPSVAVIIEIARKFITYCTLMMSINSSSIKN